MLDFNKTCMQTTYTTGIQIETLSSGFERGVATESHLCNYLLKKTSMKEFYSSTKHAIQH